LKSAAIQKGKLQQLQEVVGMQKLHHKIHDTRSIMQSTDRGLFEI